LDQPNVVPAGPRCMFRHFRLDDPPDSIYADTTFIMALLIERKDVPRDARHKESVRFLERLKFKGTVLFTSSSTAIELWNAALKVLLREHYPRERIGYLLERPNEISETVFAELAALERRRQSLLNKYGTRRQYRELRVDRDISNKAIELMESYQLRSFDALHIASALTAGATNVVSFDKHWEVVPHLTLWDYRKRARAAGEPRTEDAGKPEAAYVGEEGSESWTRPQKAAIMEPGAQEVQ